MIAAGQEAIERDLGLAECLPPWDEPKVNIDFSNPERSELPEMDLNIFTDGS